MGLSNYNQTFTVPRVRLGLIMLLILLIGLSGTPLPAWADEIPANLPEPPPALIRTRLSPENPVVGQQVEFQVDVFVDTWFAGAPQFPEVQVDDAIALLPPSSSINLNQRIDGKSYVGQRRTYFLFPQLPGRYPLPEVSVTLTPAQPGETDPKPITLTSEPIDFLAQLPPDLAAQNSDSPILATPNLQVSTRLTTASGADAATLTRLHTGDSLEQTITLTATDTLASMLPAIAVEDIPGLAIYPDAPRVKNQFDRGAFTASRTDHITYLPERPGTYQLPAQSIVWWNTRTHALQTETIPSVDMRVVPTLQQRLIQLLPGLAMLILILGGLVYFRRSLLNTWRTYRRLKQQSEAARWQYLRRACQQNDPHAAWNSLVNWLASPKLADEGITLDTLRNPVQNSSLEQALRSLETVLFAPQDGENSRHWQGQPLLTALSTQRQRLRSRLKQQPLSQNTMSLPPLNPPLQKQT